MQLWNEKLALIRCLSPNERFQPVQLRRLSSGQQRALLLWLDQSGLALYLLARLQQVDATSLLPGELLVGLQQRLEANRRRTDVLKEQLAQVVAALDRRRLPYAILKGFSLSPQFCPDPALRHQIDIDVLIRPEHTSAASDAILSSGYRRIRSLTPGELVFQTPLSKTPSRRDEVYSLPKHFKVELHSSLWEEVGGMTLNAPADNLLYTLRRFVEGVSFPVVPTERALIFHLLHVFRHLLAGWIRPSWLYEIAWFLNAPDANPELCRRAMTLISNTLSAQACGLPLCMASQLFQVEIPAPLARGLVDTLPREMKAWCSEYAERVVLCDPEGTKLGLLVERSFAKDRRAWRKRLLRRLAPFQGRPYLGDVEAGQVIPRWSHRLKNGLFLLQRLRFHLIADLEFSWEALRFSKRLRNLPRPPVNDHGGLFPAQSI